jgi:hypothetical protein
MFLIIFLYPSSIPQSPQSRVRLHAGSGESKHLEIFLPVPAAAQLGSDGKPWPHARNLSIQLTQSKAKVREEDDHANLISRKMDEEPKTIVHEEALTVLVVLTDSLDQITEPGVYPLLKLREGQPVFQLVVCPLQQFLAWAPRCDGVTCANG